MSKKILSYSLLSTFLVLFLFMGVMVYAQTEDGATSTEDESSNIDSDSSDDREKVDIGGAFKGVVEDRIQKLRGDVNAVRSTLQEKRDNRKEQEESPLKTEEMRGVIPNREIRQQERADDRENFASSTEKRAELEARKTARQALIRTEMENRARAYFARTVTRFEAAIDRIEGVIERTESRITKLTEMEINTDEAEAKLVEAKASLVLAQASLATVQSAIDTALSAENPKEAVQASVRTIFEETKRYIKEAHANVVEAIKSLKASTEEKRGDVELNNEDSSSE